MTGLASDPAVAGAGSLPLPALLRRARGVYAAAVAHALDGAGYGDVPRNGSYVLVAIAAPGVPLGAVIAQLGVSKQAAGQLVDTLVVRHYLERSVDPSDRRRLVVTLTDRGRAAADQIRGAVAAVDLALEAAIGTDGVAHARAALAALGAIDGASLPHAPAAPAGEVHGA